LYGSRISLRTWDISRRNIGYGKKEDIVKLPSNPKEAWGFSAEEAVNLLTEMMEEEREENNSDPKKGYYYK